VLALAALLTACAGAPAAPPTDTVAMAEFRFAPAAASAAAGATLSVVNEGDLVHDFNLRPPGGARITGTPAVAPGDRTDLTLDVPPGDYQTYCTVPGHEESGMTGEFTVTD